MKETTISTRGLLSKEDIAEIVRFLWKIQKRTNPERDKTKYFLIWISNDEYSDEEVRQLIKDNFKDIKVKGLTEENRIGG